MILLLWTHSAGIVLGQAAESLARAAASRLGPKAVRFRMEASDAKRRSLAQEAQMLRELGFDGVGYLLWFDNDRDTPLRMFGEDLDMNLRTLDQAGCRCSIRVRRSTLIRIPVPTIRGSWKRSASSRGAADNLGDAQGTSPGR